MIRDACDTSSGGTPSRTISDFFTNPPEGHPWLASRELTGGYVHAAEEHISQLGLENSSAKYFPVDTVLLAMYGATAGKVGRLAVPMTTSQAICGMIAKKGICHQGFLYYLIKNESWKIVWKNALGGAQPNISQFSINNHPVELPDSATQVKIFNHLNQIDMLIENQESEMQVLQDVINSLFLSWFIDFDPVKAKAEGKLPFGMDEETASLFPDSFEDSKLGPIPTGWKVGTLLDIARFQNGYAFKNEDWCDEGIPVIKIGSVKPGFVDLNSCSYVDEDCVEGLQKFQLNGGDIVVGMTGYVGEAGLVLNSNVKPYLNQRVGKIFPLEKRYYEFIYLNLRNTSFKSHAENFATGSAQANVSSSNLMAYTIVIPPRKIMECFSNLTNPMIQQILHSFSMINFASNIRDSMLPKLMSGELKLS